ncbi:MAG: alpha/beta hydrolase fold domain-containing protein [Phycisphaerae bacterium]|nr:alpha/beta hydrolase fold domain-containing protein [Phycisphaerae bacterium]
MVQPVVRIVGAVICACGLVSCQGFGILPPDQPAEGPGGSDYDHASVRTTVVGRGGEHVWIFEPASPSPQTAPLILFGHGWTAINPKYHGGWIEHLVRRGNIIVYPRYQESIFTPSEEFLPNAIAALRTSIELLQSDDHVSPDLDCFAVVGHSAGAALVVNLAAVAEREGLPAPKAIMAVEPAALRDVPRHGAPLEDLSQIPAQTLLLSVVGDRDTLVGDLDGKRIFNETTAIPLENKDYVVLVSDDHGSPALIADHTAPLAYDEDYDVRSLHTGYLPELCPFLGLECSRRGIDALDYYGLWKLFDGLTDAAFYGINRHYALGDTAEQRFMGLWSDGTPVNELRVTDDPD